LLTLNDHDYVIGYWSELPAQGAPKIRGYQMTHIDGERSYDLRPVNGTLECECNDHLFNARACKHILCCLELIADGKIAAPDVSNDEPCME